MKTKKLSLVVLSLGLFAALPLSAQDRLGIALGGVSFTQTLDAGMLETKKYSGSGFRVSSMPESGFGIALRNNTYLLTNLDGKAFGYDTDALGILNNSAIGLGSVLKLGGFGLQISLGVGLDFLYDDTNIDMYLGGGFVASAGFSIDFEDWALIAGTDFGYNLLTVHAENVGGEYNVDNAYYFTIYVGVEM